MSDVPAHPRQHTSMDRRRFLLASLAGAFAVPLAAEAQPAGKVHQIGFLPSGASAAHRQQLEALRDGLRELGYVPDKTLVITAVWPATPSELPAAAADLVRQNPEVIVAPSTPAVLALKPLTGTIPIVFASAADPVGAGLVASIARPGGNVTGVSQQNLELSGKRMELLREAAVVSRKSVALWFSPDDSPAAAALAETIFRETEGRGAARSASRCGCSRSRAWKISHRRWAVFSPNVTGADRSARTTGLRPCTPDRRTGAETEAPGDRPLPSFCRARWSDGLRRRPGQPAAPGGHLR
jgi:hypothetical protein